jgi:hypothetical protein
MTWYSGPLPVDAIERLRGLPPPRFRPGEGVRSLVGAVGDSVVRTEVVAPVAWYAWHWKRATWMYRLAVRGRRRGRWYLERELVRAIAANGNERREG